MLDLFLKLIERLVDLAKESQRVKRSLHDDFIIPVMQQFEHVHQEYISSFQAYRELVTSNVPTFKEDNPVFSKLESDMIFTHASREKLRAMSKGLMLVCNGYNRSDKDKIRSFIWLICEYIDSISDSAGGQSLNQARGSILETLHHIAARDKTYKVMTPSEEAEREILKKMWEMQDLYANIQRVYQQARIESLK